nr:hypothetical protein [Mycobacterium xenopi]
MKKYTRFTATTVIVTAGLGLAGLGAASVAQARPGPLPDYHWCPGQFWDPGWGPNWDWDDCHDDHHRDIDGPDHARDYWGGPVDDRGPDVRGPADWHPGPGRPDDHGPGPGR